MPKPLRPSLTSSQSVPQPIGWNFWFQWVLANTIAVIVMYWTTRNWYLGFLEGFVLGLAQWLLLRKYLSHSVRWIWSTFGGWFLGYCLISILLLPLGMIGSWSEPSFWIKFGLLLGAISGAVVGFSQQLVLVDQQSVLRDSDAWRFSTTLWTLVATVSGALGMAAQLSLAFGLVSWVVIGVVGVMYGMMTGGIMVWLLRQLFRLG